MSISTSPCVVSNDELSFGILGNNGKFVCGENGLAPVRCDRDVRDVWEIFTIIDLADGRVAFQCMEKYLCSENGLNPMNCNRTEIGAWETFEWINNDDWTFSLRGNNAKYVSSENGEGPMNCNRDWIGSWEKFARADL
ncbi:MAG: hypothetical protein QM650_14160 [Microlunatus sp.]